MLVIDDEVAVTRVLTRVLHREGITTLVAQSVEEARAMLADETVQMVVCDVNLGDGTVVDVLAVLGSLGRALPVVIIAGNPSEASESNAIAHRLVRGVVAKPFDLETLRRMVQETLSSSPG